MRAPRIGVERFGVSLILAGLGAVLASAVLLGVGAPPWAAVGVSAVGALAGAAWMAPRLPSGLDGASRRTPVAAALWLVVGLASIVQTARLTAFMVDEARVERALFAFDDFFVHHSCVSAYFAAAGLQRGGVPNVYERTLYEGRDGEPVFIGGFVTDVFLYPPPFLLLPRLALAASGDFRAWRPVWFGLEGGIVVLALVVVAWWIGGRQGLAAALLAPLVWLSLPTLMTLQFGNVHIAAIAVAMLAMVAFERGRHALGGALLGAVVVTKIFPGVLLVYLLFQRRWRSLGWATAFAAGFVLLALLVLGPAPFEAFLTYHLPRLSSGAAFETLFTHPDVIACNHAVYGVVQKLELLGVPGMSQTTAASAAMLYGVALIGVAAVGARVAQERLPMALVWLALLQLAALRSPFSPDVYAQFALLWILALLLARGEWRAWQMILLGLAVVLANNVVPTSPPARWFIAMTLVDQLLFIGLCVWVVLVHQTGRHRRAMDESVRT